MTACIPGNEGRGYVLRRIMRRTIRMMRLLGAHEPTMLDLVDASVLTMAPQYPELNDEVNRIRQIAVGEEGAFLQTLRTGTTIFDTAVASVRSGGGSQLSGDEAFALHDTYGFPFDLTLEMASEQGLSVDEEGFRRLMQQQRERAKADSKARKSGMVATTAYRDILQAGGMTTFTGYTEAVTDSLVIGIVKDGETVPAARVGDHVEIVLDRSPFYAEAGGQLGDHGRLMSREGAAVDVYDVQTPVPGLFIHRGEVLDGELVSGTSVTSIVDVARRKAISRAHTATHMIHRAFRERLGDTATQMGSENAPGRLRFDFPSPTAVAPEVLREVEQHVNEVLIDDLAVSAPDDDAGGGAGDGRHGALRREVRRPRARGVGGRLGARALRRDPCPALGPARCRDLPLRGVHRRGRAASRGAGREPMRTGSWRASTCWSHGSRSS